MAYFFAAPTEDDRESVESAAAEVIGDFHADYNIEATCHALSAGVPMRIDFWALVRAGVSVS